MHVQWGVAPRRQYLVAGRFAGRYRPPAASCRPPGIPWTSDNRDSDDPFLPAQLGYAVLTSRKRAITILTFSSADYCGRVAVEYREPSSPLSQGCGIPETRRCALSRPASPVRTTRHQPPNMDRIVPSRVREDNLFDSQPRGYARRHTAHSDAYGHVSIEWANRS